MADGVGHCAQPVKARQVEESSRSGDHRTLGVVASEAHTHGDVIGRIVFLVITLIAFYFVLPGLLATFDALPRLRDVYPAWFVVVLVLEGASFVAIWELQRIALGRQGLVRHRLLARGGQRGRPGGAGWRRGGRRAPAQDARPGRLRRPDRHDRARGDGSAVDGHPVRAARCWRCRRCRSWRSTSSSSKGRCSPSSCSSSSSAFGAWMIRSDRAIAAVGRAVGWIATKFHIGDGASSAREWSSRAT